MYNGRRAHPTIYSYTQYTQYTYITVVATSITVEHAVVQGFEYNSTVSVGVLEIR